MQPPPQQPGPFGSLNPVEYYEQYNLLDPNNFFQPDQFPLPQVPGWPYFPQAELPDDRARFARPTTPPPSLYSFTGQGQADQDVVMDGAFLNGPTGPPVVTDAGDLHGMSLAELERLAQDLIQTPAFDNLNNKSAHPPAADAPAPLSYSPMSTDPSIFDTSPDLHSWDSPSTVGTAPTPSTAASTSSVHIPLQVPPRRSNSSASQYSMSSLGSAAPAGIAKRKSVSSVAEKKSRAEECVAKKLAEDLKRCRSVLPKLAPRPEHPTPVKAKSIHSTTPSSRPPTARHTSLKKTRKPTDKPYAPRAPSMEIEMHAAPTNDAHALAMAYFSRGAAPPPPAVPAVHATPRRPSPPSCEMIDLTESPPESPREKPAVLPQRTSAPVGSRPIAPAPARASTSSLNEAFRSERFQPPVLERAPPAPPAFTASPVSSRAMSSTPTYTAPSPEIVVMDASSPPSAGGYWPAAEGPGMPHQPPPDRQSTFPPPQSRPSPPHEPMDQSTIRAKPSPMRLSAIPTPTGSGSPTPSPTLLRATIPPDHPLAGLSIPGPTAPQSASVTPVPLAADNPSPEALLLAAHAKNLPAAQQASLAALAAAMARGGASPQTSVSAVAAAAVRRGSANTNATPTPPAQAPTVGGMAMPNWQPFVPLPRAGSVYSNSAYSGSGYSPSIWSASSAGEEPFRLSGAWLGAKP